MKEMKEGMIFTLLNWGETNPEENTISIYADIGNIQLSPEASSLLVGYSRNPSMNPIGKKFQVIKKISRINNNEYFSVKEV